MGPPRVSSCWLDLAVGFEDGGRARGMQEPPESWRDQETDCPQNFQEQPDLLRPRFWCQCQMSDPRIVRWHVCVVLSQCVCDRLLHQEINTQERKGSPGPHPSHWELAKESDKILRRFVCRMSLEGEGVFCGWSGAGTGESLKEISGQSWKEPEGSVPAPPSKFLRLISAQKGVGTGGEGRG